MHQILVISNSGGSSDRGYVLVQTVMPSLVMGALAQSFASTTTYPYQVIKARLQQGGPSALKYRGTWDCTTKILRYFVLRFCIVVFIHCLKRGKTHTRALAWKRRSHEGYRGLFKGLAPNLLKVIPTGAIVFASYEQIHRLLTDMLVEG